MFITKLTKTEYIKDFATKHNISQRKAKGLINTVYAHLLKSMNEYDCVFTPLGKTMVVKKEECSTYQNITKIEIKMIEQKEKVDVKRNQKR
ncbi:hypothetical protein EMELA_v1c02600 [Mesoplasma melaleucae]|uniref:HU family DNA-binding protein n=1 Tax=Mesoplasma melaleucae TaxID=81459 RepID=A0A2K8NYW5_9MOLU|nr:hypothetical protein [Mesoplasma melaleucae]ATZ17833.1 hypothetical protein EMELA_v1c02600 [Mesoplasma melaleucae]